MEGWDTALRYARENIPKQGEKMADMIVSGLVRSGLFFSGILQLYRNIETHPLSELLFPPMGAFPLLTPPESSIPQ